MSIIKYYAPNKNLVQKKMWIQTISHEQSILFFHALNKFYHGNLLQKRNEANYLKI